jgi:hypothetical protein
MKINIFKNNNLEINLPTFVDSRALICANSGGGKSYAVRKILEESSNKVMSIILDVEGEFRTLRERFDFLLIGNDGDVKLNMKSARLIPKKIMELEVSTIIDISDLKRSERIKYVKEFLEGLMELPRKGENDISYWKPCLIVLDEAHLLAGQQEKQDSCSSVIDLMTRGRKRGYCGILCTQRISKLHKDAVAEANNILIGRTGLDIDMKRASEILGFTSKQDMLTLRDLEAGEFYVFGTAISRHVTKAFVGEVQTTHPKVGMDLRKEIIKPTDNIIKILSKIKDLPQEAEKELRELNDYKKEVIELKRQIRVLETSKPKEQIVKEIVKIDIDKLNEAKQEGFEEARKKYKDYVLTIENNTKFLRKPIEKLISDAQCLLNSKAFSIVSDTPIYIVTPSKIRESSKVIQINSHPRAVGKSSQTNTIGELRERPIIQTRETSDDTYNLNLCEKKLYSLLFQYSERSFTKAQIGVFTGYSHKSGGFNNAISRLRQLGLIEGSGNDLRAKEINPNLAQEFDFSKEAIISKLNKCEREIYNVLLDNPENTFGKEELAMATETQYSSNSGGFNNAISRLNTLGLIQRTNGMIRLNPELLEI